VQDRAKETAELLSEKKGLRKEIVLGRSLLEVHERLEELEEKLGIKIKEGEDDDDDEDEDDEDEDEDTPESSSYNSAVRRLRKQSEQYLMIVFQSSKIGLSHPFLVSLQPRVEEVRKTLILDLSASLRQARSSNDMNAVLGFSQVFGILEAQNDALKVLKGG
jgi:hypothetical protein